MTRDVSSPQAGIGEPAPKLPDLTDNMLPGDVWERPELSKRDRSLITVSALVSLNRSEQLPFHLNKALANRGRPGTADGKTVRARFRQSYYSPVTACHDLSGLNRTIWRASVAVAEPRSFSQTTPL